MSNAKTQTSLTAALKEARQNHVVVHAGDRQYALRDYDASRDVWVESMRSYTHHAAVSINASSIAADAAIAYLESRGQRFDGDQLAEIDYRAGGLTGSARDRLRSLVNRFGK